MNIHFLVNPWLITFKFTCYSRLYCRWNPIHIFCCHVWQAYGKYLSCQGKPYIKKYAQNNRQLYFMNRACIHVYIYICVCVYYIIIGLITVKPTCHNDHLNRKDIYRKPIHCDISSCSVEVSTHNNYEKSIFFQNFKEIPLDLSSLAVIISFCIMFMLSNIYNLKRLENWIVIVMHEIRI